MCYRKNHGRTIKGIRVIDWTIWQQGPVATTMLADMGAEVIKIEEREKGDPGRWIIVDGRRVGNRKGRRNYYFEANNRHKQSLDARPAANRQAREIVYKLAAKSDVFVQNFRKGVADRLGLGYKELERAQSRRSSTPVPPATAPPGRTAASRRSITWRRRARES